MHYLSKIYQKILNTARKSHKRNYMPEKKQFLHQNIPYFSQWESSELVEDIIYERMSAKDDPLWQNSGARTLQEYEIWSWNGCGMACLKMILAFKLGKEIPLVKLGRRCQKFGGYIPKEGELDGLYYEPFLKFIREDYGLAGRIISPMEIEDMLAELERENFVIASVSHEIRNPEATPSKRGGHLVLLLGYHLPQQTLFLHNPSGLPPDSQEYTQISFKDFNKFFAHRGISITGDW